MQLVLGLLWEDRQLNVDAREFTVRPPAAPTTDGLYLVERGPGRKDSGPLTYRMAPSDQDSRTTFIVTSEVIEAGNVMKHVREGVLNGISGIRNEQRFEKTSRSARRGDCVRRVSKAVSPIPLGDHRLPTQVVLVLEHADRSGIEQEAARVSHGQSDPAGAEHAAEVTVREDCHRSLEQAQSRNHAIRPDRYLLR